MGSGEELLLQLFAFKMGEIKACFHVSSREEAYAQMREGSADGPKCPRAETGHRSEGQRQQPGGQMWLWESGNALWVASVSQWDRKHQL